MDESDVKAWPTHAEDCALVTSHHLTCTCGATYEAVMAAKERLAAEQGQEPDPVEEIICRVTAMAKLTIMARDGQLTLQQRQ